MADAKPFILKKIEFWISSSFSFLTLYLLSKSTCTKFKKSVNAIKCFQYNNFKWSLKKKIIDVINLLVINELLRSPNSSSSFHHNNNGGNNNGNDSENDGGGDDGGGNDDGNKKDNGDEKRTRTERSQKVGRYLKKRSLREQQAG